MGRGMGWGESPFPKLPLVIRVSLRFSGTLQVLSSDPRPNNPLSNVRWTHCYCLGVCCRIYIFRPSGWFRGQNILWSRSF